MSHSYAGLSSFNRIMLLIATFVKYPGVGHMDCFNPTRKDDTLAEVLTYLAKTAEEIGIALPTYSKHTIQGDLKTLRKYGILERRKYRWGYYLGTGIMHKEDLRTMFNAIGAQAEVQGEQSIIDLYRRLERRLQGLEARNKMLYPVRAQLDRSIVYTNPEEMMEKQAYKGTLFEKIEQIEDAILNGCPIELLRCRSPYSPKSTGRETGFPLQLIHSGTAWYLLQEDYKDGNLFTCRIDRFSDHLKTLKDKGRSISHQRSQLRAAHRLIRKGWGLNLGSKEGQQRELEGTEKLVKVQVRFFEGAIAFIQEGEKRHPTQAIKRGPLNKKGQLQYVDYIVDLPERSINAFYYWVGEFTGNAQFISPPYLVERHQSDMHKAISRYSLS